MTTASSLRATSFALYLRVQRMTASREAGQTMLENCSRASYQSTTTTPLLDPFLRVRRKGNIGCIVGVLRKIAGRLVNVTKVFFVALAPTANQKGNSFLDLHAAPTTLPKPCTRACRIITARRGPSWSCFAEKSWWLSWTAPTQQPRCNKICAVSSG